jgi:hypothetical protein
MSTKFDLIACYLFAMISVRYAFQWKGNIVLGLRRGKNLIQLSTLKSSGAVNKITNPNEIQEYQNILMKHQKKVEKLSLAENVRTLIYQSTGYGILSTISKSLEGFPFGSVVGFQLNEESKPFFVLSKLSPHTKDLLDDSRASLTILSRDFKGAESARATITGTISTVSDDLEVQKLRDIYLSKHKEAFWIDFG